MKTKHIIELEDKGQDALFFHVEDNKVVKTTPFQTSMWKGAYVPIKNVKVGKPMPIHHPPNIRFGYLKYNVISIQKATK